MTDDNIAAQILEKRQHNVRKFFSLLNVRWAKPVDADAFIGTGMFRSNDALKGIGDDDFSVLHGDCTDLYNIVAPEIQTGRFRIENYKAAR